MEIISDSPRIEVIPRRGRGFLSLPSPFLSAISLPLSLRFRPFPARSVPPLPFLAGLPFPFSPVPSLSLLFPVPPGSPVPSRCLPLLFSPPVPSGSILWATAQLCSPRRFGKLRSEPLPCLSSVQAVLATFTPLPGAEFHQPHSAIYFAADCPESTPEECAQEDAHRYGMAVTVEDAVPVLANKFRAVLTEWLGAETVSEILRINRQPDTLPNQCASGDFCDSNMAMLEAWESVIPETHDMQSDAHNSLWNSAWFAFKAQN